jgi:uncharacterized protein YkwD
MSWSPFAPSRRRLASLALTVILGAAIVVPGAAVATTSTIDEAGLTALESAMVSALNADRAAYGLVAVRVDPRLMAIARARSDDMVAKDYFSHTQPDGRNVFSILTAQGITWYSAGEIIAWNNYPIDTTVSAANRQWMSSAGHRAIIISTNFNYVGVGVAIDPDTGKKVWTAVYLKGPDRTAAKAKVFTPRVLAGATATTRTVKIAWTGYDPRLQVLTSGLRSYAVQRRVDGGSWATTVSATTLREKYFTLALGHLYEFRVSARDRAGNPGAWVTRVVDLR